MIDENIWKEFINNIGDCRLCHNTQVPFVEKNSFPIFMKEFPYQTHLMFIAEAPNFDDTFNKKKGYLTISPTTDPSGKFFHRLLTDVLRFNERQFCITNAVLCLPKKKNGNYPVTAKQIKFCLPHLINQIQTYNPKIVCTLGSIALNAVKKIEDHGYKSLKYAVGKNIKWFDRILFPLFHTSFRARFGPTGRTENLQIEDWRKLKLLYDEITQ
jgi:uracil-DNA glycosylase family 4